MLVRQIAIVADGVPQLSLSDLAKTASAIQTQATRDFGPIWEVDATVDAFPSLDDVPLGHWPVIIVAKLDDPGAGGYHLDKNNQPFAMVLFEPAWTLAASHEALEMLADPFGNRLVAGPSINPASPDNRVRYLLEVCDPCEASDYSYTVNGVVVSDFITPHFHDPIETAGARYSFTGAIKGPRQVLTGGYISFEDPAAGRWYQGFNNGRGVTFKAAGAISGVRSLREFVNVVTPTKPSDMYEANSPPVQRAAKFFAGAQFASKANSLVLQASLSTASSSGMLLPRFGPPAGVSDLSGEGLQAWSDSVESFFQGSIANLEACTGKGKAQFVDPTQVDVSSFAIAEISWHGFPLSVRVGKTDDEAYRIADAPGKAGRNVQDEYLEWYIHRDGNGDIVAVDFTCENPEYWMLLFQEDSDTVVSLYQSFVGPAVVKSDLVKVNGTYNINNKWNLTDGAMHLRQTNNTLPAEIEIAAASTITRTDKDGSIVTSGADLCNGAGLGVATRASDPHIAELVNAYARGGRYLSLMDPVGLYMKPNLDVSGWTTPDGSDPRACWNVLRGSSTAAVRARFEVPNQKFKFSDIKIDGTPLTYAGQIADRIIVFLTAVAGPAGGVKTTSVPLAKACQAAVKTAALTSVAQSGDRSLTRK